jgi:3-oxoacyl-[acyl-carrier protein] reductase
MDLRLDGRRAIVTGGSRGIGRAIVEILADEGCSVAFCARGSEGVEQALAAIRDRGASVGDTSVGDTSLSDTSISDTSGASVTGAALDVGDGEAYRTWLTEAVSGLGGLDVLVCNATGYARPGEDGWRGALEIDVLGIVRALEVVLPALEDSGVGSIVVLGSLAAVDIFLPGGEAYGAMKAAVLHHSSVLAKAHGAKGIRCNAVSPGAIEFEGNVWRQRRDEGHPLYESVRSGSPFGRLGTAEEVARAVVFLASPAASWITGVNLVLDGGFTNRVDY